MEREGERSRVIRRGKTWKNTQNKYTTKKNKYIKKLIKLKQSNKEENTIKIFKKNSIYNEGRTKHNKLKHKKKSKKIKKFKKN